MAAAVREAPEARKSKLRRWASKFMTKAMKTKGAAILILIIASRREHTHTHIRPSFTNQTPESYKGCLAGSCRYAGSMSIAGMDAPTTEAEEGQTRRSPPLNYQRSGLASRAERKRAQMAKPRLGPKLLLVALTLKEIAILTG